MNKDKIELEKLENACHELISRILLTCESELRKCNDNDKALPSAAMTVRDSILTFLALVNHK